MLLFCRAFEIFGMIFDTEELLGGMILCLRSVEVTAEGPPVGGSPPVEVSEEPF